MSDPITSFYNATSGQPIKSNSAAKKSVVTDESLLKELSVSLRYLHEVTRSGRYEVLGTSVSALLDVLIKVVNKGSNDNKTVLAPFHEATVEILKWADAILLRYVKPNAEENPESKNVKDLEGLDGIKDQLEAAIKDLFKHRNGNEGKLASKFDAPPNSLTSTTENTNIKLGSNNNNNSVSEPANLVENSTEPTKIITSTIVGNNNNNNIGEDQDIPDDIRAMLMSDQNTNKINNNNGISTQQQQQQESSSSKTSSRRVITSSSNISSSGGGNMQMSEGGGGGGGGDGGGGGGHMITRKVIQIGGKNGEEIDASSNNNNNNNSDDGGQISRTFRTVSSTGGRSSSSSSTKMSSSSSSSSKQMSSSSSSSSSTMRMSNSSSALTTQSAKMAEMMQKLELQHRDSGIWSEANNSNASDSAITASMENNSNNNNSSSIVAFNGDLATLGNEGNDESDGSGRLFSDKSLSNILQGFNQTKDGGSSAGSGTSTPRQEDNDKNGEGSELTETLTSNQEKSSRKDLTQEEEEESPDGRKIMRRMQSSKSMMSSSSRTVTKTSSGTPGGAGGKNGSGDPALMEMLMAKAGDDQKGEESPELTITEKAEYKVGGRTGHRTLWEDLNAEHESAGETKVKAVESESFGQDSTGNRMALMEMDGDGGGWKQTGEWSDGEDDFMKRSSSSAGGGSSKPGSKVKRTEQVSMQSACSQSLNREAKLNGELIGIETKEAMEGKNLNLSKSQTFQDGALVKTEGGGTCDEMGFRKHHVEDLRGSTDDPPPLHTKKRHVDTYIGIFKPPEMDVTVHNEDGTQQGELKSNALASYVILRDNLCRHEEAIRRRQTTFNFSDDAPGGEGTETTVANAFFNSSSLVSKYECRVEACAESLMEWMNNGSSSGGMDEDWFTGETGYRSLMDYWDTAQPSIQFPSRLALPPPPPPSSVPIPIGFTASSQSESAESQKESAAAKQDQPETDNVILKSLDVSDQIVMKRKSSSPAVSLGKKNGTADPAQQQLEVKGGTPDALLVYATQPGTHIMLYQEAFLITYRTFMRPADLIQKLIWRYQFMAAEATSNPDKMKAARNTYCLLVRVVHDLGAPDVTKEIVSELNNFTYNMIADGNLVLGRLLRTNLLASLPTAFNPNVLPQPSVPTGREPAPPTQTPILSMKSEQVAEQLTYRDSQLFQKIKLSEMLEWSQEQHEDRAPNLVAFTEHFNRISFWVRTLVIKQSDQKEREKVFMKFTKIMKHLRRLGNFNSYLAILSALDSGPIRRLDWSRDLLVEHAAIMDSKHSFRVYRSALANSKPPALPYIGLILQDLTFVHMGNQGTFMASNNGGGGGGGGKDEKQPPEEVEANNNHLNSPPECGLINFSKRWQQFTILDSVRRFKSWPYHVKKDDKVQKQLGEFEDSLAEDAIWDLSETIKPRVAGKIVNSL